jgi:hypothetical protein
MNLYRSKDWKAFRDEVIRLDGGTCVRCLHGPSEGAVLQVHHKIYFQGRKPWEYPHDACEVLCKSCHAQEHGIIAPKHNWDLVGHDDLGGIDGSCEYCGTAIRYVFLVQHEKWPALEVGEICCDNLTATTFASDCMDSNRRFLDRRKRFVSSSRWTVNKHGVAFVQQNGIEVGIVPVDRIFKLRMNGKIGRLTFASTLEAKMKAFEIIDSGVAAQYLHKLAGMAARHPSKPLPPADGVEGGGLKR